jgi:hypothetical protein
MAIDQEIQQKVDAYRNNPQALQQRYAQNQQLVDLLALQKIKSEMDAAKRDIEMKMQQQPGTIKQQREQELMERTKQDMMDQLPKVGWVPWHHNVHPHRDLHNRSQTRVSLCLAWPRVGRLLGHKITHIICRVCMVLLEWITKVHRGKILLPKKFNAFAKWQTKASLCLAWPRAASLHSNKVGVCLV